MFNNMRFGFVLAITALCSGTWILAKQAQDSTPKLERQAVAYSIYNPNNDAVMLDSLSGKTWMLRRMEDGKPTWLPISRVDSEKEAVHLWKKISDHAERTGKNETNLPLDVLLKDRGYLGIPLDRLKTGYLGIEVKIEGKKVYLMLDTGAPVTHLDLERTKHLQLKWQPWDQGDNKKSAGFSKSFCEIANLEIGGRAVRRLIIGGHDESDMNKFLKLYLDPPVDGELGSDVLAKLNAIIDYSTLKLYVRHSELQESKIKKEKRSEKENETGSGKRKELEIEK